RCAPHSFPTRRSSDLILHDVLDVFLVQRVGLQKLLDGVQPLGALGIEVVEPALLVLLLLLQEAEVVHSLVLLLFLRKGAILLDLDRKTTRLNSSHVKI